MTLRQNSQQFACITGLRVVYSLWVVIFHCYNVMCFSSGAVGLDSSVLIGLQNAPWRWVIFAFGTQVDAFFMISGFFLSLQLLKPGGLAAIDSEAKIPSMKLVQHVILAIVKRYGRIMPGMICAIAYSYAVSDITINPVHLIRRVLTIDFDMPSAPTSLIVVWSNKVEVVAAAIVTACVLVLGRFVDLRSSSGYVVAAALFLLSNAPLIMLMHRYPEYTMANVGKQPSGHLIIGMSFERVQWMQSHYANAKGNPAANLPYSSEDNGGWARLGYVRVFYEPWWNRLGPFFIGLGLAIAVLQSYPTSTAAVTVSVSKDTTISSRLGMRGMENKSTDNKGAVQDVPAVAATAGDAALISDSTTAEKKLSVLTHFKHGFLLLFSVIALSLPVIFSLILPRRYIDPRDVVPPSPEDLDSAFAPLNLFLMVFIRPLYSFGVAYMLYRCILPPGHPLHLRMLNSLLSLSLLRPLAELSYTIYILHYRVILDVLFWLLPLGYLDSVLGPQRGVAHLLVVSAATYILTAGLAYVVYHGAEKHMQKAGARLIAAVQSYIGPSNDSSRKVSTGKAGRDKQS